MTNARLHVPRSLFLGFEGLFDDLERIHSSARSGDKYPPHNVVKVDNENFLIELAVAGFSEADLTVEVKEGILKIIGEKRPRTITIGSTGTSSEKKLLKG